MTMKTTFIALAVLLLTGCSSAPNQIHYYLLDNGGEATAQQPGLPLLVLDQVQLPDYLKQSFLVLATGEHELYFARQHVWAEDLDGAIRRLLIRHLNQAQQQFEVIARTDPRAPQIKDKLVVAIEQLLSTDTSTVELHAQYWVLSERQIHQQVRLQDSLTDNGYPHAVAQQRQLLQRLAADIAKGLQP